MSRWPVAVTAAGAVVGMVAALTVSFAIGDHYRAAALLEVSPGPDPLAAEAGSVALSAEVLAETYADLLDSPGFLAQIAPRVAGGTLSAHELADRVEARRPDVTALVEVDAEGSSPAAASALAGQVTDAFIDLVAQLERQRAVLVEQELRRRIEEITERLPVGPRAALLEERAALHAELAALAADRAGRGSGVALAAPATADPEALGPGLNETVAGGALLGLVLALGGWLLGARPRLPAAAAATVKAPPVPHDTTPPSVQLVYPAAGATLTGGVTLRAYASDEDSGVARVTFLVSTGTPEWTPVAESTQGVAAALWDTSTLADGDYWLSAVAEDQAGLSAASELVPIRVANQG